MISSEIFGKFSFKIFFCKFENKQMKPLPNLNFLWPWSCDVNSIFLQIANEQLYTQLETVVMNASLMEYMAEVQK